MPEDWGHVFHGEANIDFWSPRVAEVLREQGITKLRLRGWKHAGFEPLLPFREQLVRIYHEIHADDDLPDPAALGQLHRLHELSLQYGVETIDFSGLQELEIQLKGVGKVPSLSFLRGLEALERFVLIDATVEDGDLAVLLESPSLKRVFVQKRRHYTHDGDDVQAALTAKWTRGLGAFANAAADDWIALLWQRKPIAWLGTTVRDVLDYGPENDVPAIAGQFAVAAAEVIARLRGRGDGTPAPEPITRWLDEQAVEPPPVIVTNAQAALERLLTEPSGLLRLWEERGQADAWKAAVADLKRRVAEPET